MDHTDEDLQVALKNWGIVPSGTEELWEQSIAALTVIVKRMLLTDRKKFINDLYRLDVSEIKLTQTFKTLAPGDQPRAIAELILRREIQKAETRRKYPPPQMD